ncbi:alpha/beta hydrolase [Prauserella flavalba]|uniref:Esterase n=1 Tax=Prauserella flavalba TaxID=1477506 RepID=A0A318M0G7_9PSEU|nr:alpha/beta hydrolase [Prauserella flavalba]PXY21541.1 esterase [Prauserella flavalba]
MTSPRPSDVLGEIYASWAVEMSRYPDMSIELLRMIFEDWQRATAEPEDVTYRETAIGGVPGILVTPAGCAQEQVLLVMHGGGFALGSPASHRKLAGHLAKACGASAFVAGFRLAPEHPYPAALEDGLAVVDGLLERGHRIEDITPVGDSAGANLAIAMVLRLMREGRALPAQVITMSPWLDMENTGATLDTNDATDFLITREGLQANIDRYLGGTQDPRDPLVNPLHADLSGFPRLYIDAGSVESLLDDAVRLHELALKHDVDVTFVVGEGMQHVYPFMAGRDANADREIGSIAAWYRAGR